MSMRAYIRQRLWMTNNSYMPSSKNLTEVSSMFKKRLYEGQLNNWKRYQLQNLFCDCVWNISRMQKAIEELISKLYNMESMLKCNKDRSRQVLINFLLEYNNDKILEQILNKVSALMTYQSDNQIRDLLTVQIFAVREYSSVHECHLYHQMTFKYLLLTEEKQNIATVDILRTKTVACVWIALVHRAVLDVVTISVKDEMQVVAAFAAVKETVIPKCENENINFSCSDIEEDDIAEDEGTEFCDIEELKEETIQLAISETSNLASNEDDIQLLTVPSECSINMSEENNDAYFEEISIQGSNNNKIDENPQQFSSLCNEFNFDDYHLVCNDIKVQNNLTPNSITTSSSVIANNFSVEIVPSVTQSSNNISNLSRQRRNVSKEIPKSVSHQGLSANQILFSSLKPILKLLHSQSSEIKLECDLPILSNNDCTYSIIGYDLFVLQAIHFTPNLSQWAKLSSHEKIEFPIIMNLREFPSTFKYHFTVRLIVENAGNQLFGPISNIISSSV